MSEPLSRDLCERLLLAYPEWMDSLRGNVGRAHYCRHDAEDIVFEGQHVFDDVYNAGPHDLPIPTLEDLLELAQEVNGHLWEIRRIFGGACIFSANNVARDGDTPVEAVALWLLAQREGAR